MRVNVDKVLERDQKLSELDDRADALQAGASQFETSAAKLKRKYWWKNLKVSAELGEPSDPSVWSPPQGDSRFSESTPSIFNSVRTSQEALLDQTGPVSCLTQQPASSFGEPVAGHEGPRLLPDGPENPGFTASEHGGSL